MSDKKDRKEARKILKTAKPGSAAYIEAKGILSGDAPEKREYRKTTRKNNNNKTNPYKGSENPMILGPLAKKFPETAMDIEDTIGFGKLYESYMEKRGKKSLKKIDEDYSGDRPINKKMGGGKLIGGQKKLDANKDGKISGVDFEILRKKKYGGKITYRMTGGQVVDSSYD